MNISDKKLSTDSVEPKFGSCVVTDFGTGFIRQMAKCRTVNDPDGVYGIQLDSLAYMYLYRRQFRVID